MFLGQSEISVWVGWRILVAAGCFLKSSSHRKRCRLAAVGFFQGRPGLFVSAQFAILGVIADSEYVDSMGNSRTSMLYANSSGSRIIRLGHCSMINSCYSLTLRVLEVDWVFLEKYFTP